MGSLTSAILEHVQSQPEPPQHEGGVRATLHGPPLAMGEKWLFPTDSFTSAVFKVYVVGVICK